ncbi:MAG: PAS domain-containing protein [Thermoleophilia bacterium]|nr:PAS domain-containing protein [Thermoleophilia bacterium]
MASTKQHALTELESGFATIADQSFDSVMITTAGTTNKIVYVNKSFEKLTGYKAKDVIGRDPKFLQGAATDKGTIKQLITDLAAGRRFEGRTINYRADGSPFIMHWRVAPVRSGRGAAAKTTHYIAVQRVISA